MRSNKTGATGVGLALLINSSVWAQTPAVDDWDYAENAREKLMIASVTFETFGVAVRCRDNTLSVLVSGLPVASGERRLRYQMGGVDEIESVWVSGRNSQTAFALWPQRIADQLSDGGTLAIAAMDGEQVKRYQVQLPASAEAIPKVMTACGYVPDEQGSAPTGEDFAGLRWIDPPEINFPSRSSADSGLAAILCSVRANGRMRDCEIQSEFPEGAGFGRAATLGAHRSAQVAYAGDGPADIEGRKVSFLVRYNSYEALLAPPPSRLPDRGETYSMPVNQRSSD